MEPCTTVVIITAAAGLFSAGSSAARAKAEIQGTARDRDAYRQKSETAEMRLANSEQIRGTIQEESRRKDILIFGLMLLLAVAYKELLEAQRRIAAQNAELARKDAELVIMKSERDSNRRTVKNILRFGVPAVVIALVLVFFVAKQHYSHQSTPAVHVTTSHSGGDSASGRMRRVQSKSPSQSWVGSGIIAA